MEYKVPKVTKTFYAVLDYVLPGSEAKIGPLKLGGSFELSSESGVKYEIIALDGTLDKGIKVRKTGPDGATPQDITISAGKKNG